MGELKQRLLGILQAQKQGLTTQECAKQVGLDRHTIVKYLEALRSEGLVEFRQIGKAKVWTVTSAPFLALLSKDDPIGASIKEVLNQLDEQIFLVTKDRKVVWSNRHAQHVQGVRCFEKYQEHAICQGCPAEKTLQSGKKETMIVQAIDMSVAVSTIPIKDQDGQTVAFLEVVKGVQNGKSIAH